MRIVVDTNIVFSALINSSGTISDLLFNSNRIFQFFAPRIIDDELHKHGDKLARFSGLDPSEISLLKSYLIQRITLIDLEQIGSKSWHKALELTRSIDQFDAPFVALAIEIEGILWTGDKALLKGLNKQGFDDVIDTPGLKDLRIELE